MLLQILIVPGCSVSLTKVWLIKIVFTAAAQTGQTRKQTDSSIWVLDRHNKCKQTEKITAKYS